MIWNGVAVLSILVLPVAILLIRRLGIGSESLPITTEWLNDLADDRYRPMLRLLDGSDFRFVRAQEGFTPAMQTRLRKQRAEVFRGYLNMLDADFRRVCTALKIILIESATDRADLAAELALRQLSFALRMMIIQVRLSFFEWGVCTVDASPLVGMFDGMRLELKTLVPISSPIIA